MRKGTRGTAGVMTAGMIVLCLAGLAWANVYPSEVTVTATGFDTLHGTAKIEYILNENADGNGVDPGVTIEVFNGAATPIRTVTITRQLKGKHTFEWDGRDDSGNRVADNSSYTVRITAADYGYTSWTQLSVNGEVNSFYVPAGVSVNKNPASPNYGKIFVSEALAGQPTMAPARPAPTVDGIYMLHADGTDAGHATGGIAWPGGLNPHKTNFGPDDHLYVSDLSNDLSFELNADLSAATQLTTAVNRTANQWVASIIAEGTQAQGNRKIYLTNSNYDDVARKGLIMYNLGSAAAASGTGTQYIGPGAFPFYPTDAARDAAGDWYMNQFRWAGTEAPALAKYLNGTPPINTPAWDTGTTYGGAYGMDVYEPKAWVAYGQYYTGFVHVFDKATGNFVTEFDAGSRIRDIAFDAAGNIVTVDNSDERMRIWSPPDGPNSFSFTTAAIALGDKEGAAGPVISQHPADQAVCPNDAASFSVVATGGSLNYQWTKNGQDISGANSDTLQLTAATGDNGAVFTCRITDENGVAVSNPAILSVGVSFIQAPLNTQVCQNGTATFTADAGATATSYQWQRATAAAPTAFTDIDGATGQTLILANVPAGDTGTRIRCNVNGPCGSATSPVAIMTVSTGPTLGWVGIRGVETPILPGGGATIIELVSAASGVPTFQWNLNGSPLADGPSPVGVVSGSQNARLVLTEVPCSANGSKFTCTVTDDCGSKTTAQVNLPVGRPEVADPVSGSPACRNGIDDDCDNQVDCDDADCNNDFNCGPACNTPFADWDGDTDVDMMDFADFQRCYAVSPIAYPAGCECFDYNNDGSIDEDDATAFVACGSGPGIAADPDCDNRPSGAGKIVINEVVYDIIDLEGLAMTDSVEFVELYNRSTETVDISGWILRASDVAGDDNRDFIIPGGVSSGTVLLAPGGFYVFSPSSVPVPAPNPPSLYWQAIADSPTDIWEDGPDTLEILDANRDPVDTLIYARNLGTVAAAGEGAVWGNLQSVDNVDAELSVSRWFDGLDTDDNGRDFGVRRRTPGTSNQGGASVVAAYTLPAIDSANAGTVVAGLDHAFQPAVVIDPTDAGTVYGTSVVNPNAIAASPQGGKAAVMWDFATGGGNMAVSRSLMDNAGGFDLYVYLDTSFAAWGANTGYESTCYGVMGTTDTKYYMVADPEGLVHGNVVTTGGSTGLAWVFNKVKGSTSSCKLYLVDAGAGGDSSAPDATWTVHATIDMTAQPSGWYRLSISYNGTTGAVAANGPEGAVNFTTATGLAGGFYVGYREGTPADPSVAGNDFSYLRPATFDSAQ